MYGICGFFIRGPINGECWHLRWSSALLVGGIPTPLNSMKVNGKDYLIYHGQKNV